MKIDDWFVQFVNKKQPLDSEDINMLLQLIGCFQFTQVYMDHNPDIAENIRSIIDTHQRKMFDTVKEYLIITGRN